MVNKKTGFWFQKSHEEFGQLQFETRWATFVKKKQIPSVKTLQSIYLTLLSVKIH